VRPTSARNRPSPNSPLPERPSGPAIFGRATRAKTLPLIISPVLVGSALAWHHGVSIALGPLLFAIAGAGALHLAANVFNDVYDERSGADRMARIDRSAITTASGVLEHKHMTERGMMSLGIALLIMALACGVALAISRGPAVLVLGVLGALLGHQYIAPPLRYGYIGRGLGEVGIFAAYGVLPVAGAYYVQAGGFTSDAWWAGVVPGAFTTLVLFHHHFLHWRADKAAHKMTPLVVLEPQIGIIVSGFALIATYVALIAQVIVHLFPPGSLIALATMFPVAATWARAARDPELPQHDLNLLGATLGASVFTGLIVSVSLIVAR
jgi:1,4-dihydroxy-2-naphthoate polyprenyltransferase